MWVRQSIEVQLVPRKSLIFNQISSQVPLTTQPPFHSSNYKNLETNSTGQTGNCQQQSDAGRMPKHPIIPPEAGC